MEGFANAFTVDLVRAGIRLATPILLAALGAALCNRAGIFNLALEGKMLLGEQIKPEMIQSMVEVGTGVCKNIQEARADITRLRSIISGLATKNGLVIVAASTHPISRWSSSPYDCRLRRTPDFRTVPRAVLGNGMGRSVSSRDSHGISQATPAAARARTSGQLAHARGSRRRTNSRCPRL